MLFSPPTSHISLTVSPAQFPQTTIHMPSVAATLRQYPSHPAATLKHTAYGSPLRPILSTEHIPHCPRPSTPAINVHLSLRPSFSSHESEAMQTPMQIRRHCMTVLSGRHGSSQVPVLQVNTSTAAQPPRHALPRKIASGVFFVDPTSGTNDAPPSTRTLRSRDHTRGRGARVRPASLERDESALRRAPRPTLQNRRMDARRPPPRRAASSSAISRPPRDTSSWNLASRRARRGCALRVDCHPWAIWCWRGCVRWRWCIVRRMNQVSSAINLGGPRGCESRVMSGSDPGWRVHRARAGACVVERGESRALSMCLYLVCNIIIK
jgi:hypothetical protein